MSRQVVGLIEASSQEFPWVERYRHDRVCVIEQRTAGLLHQDSEWPGQHTPALVLECVNDGAEGAFVAASALRRLEGVRSAGIAR